MKNRSDFKPIVLIVASVAALLRAGPAFAQENHSFKIDSASFNAGGRPDSGLVAESASFRLSVDAIGDAVVGRGLISPGFALDGGSVGQAQPPSEVANLHFVDATTLSWDADPSAGDYAIYQGTVGPPFDTSYGTCAQPPPPITVHSVTVAAVPASGSALFYLVTVRNRLGEEGTKGFNSSGAERANPSPCP